MATTELLVDDVVVEVTGGGVVADVVASCRGRGSPWQLISQAAEEISRLNLVM